MSAIPLTTVRARKSAQIQLPRNMRSALARSLPGWARGTSASFVADHVSQEERNKYRHDEKQHNRNRSSVTHSKIRNRLLEHEVSQNRRTAERTAVCHHLHKVKRTQGTDDSDDHRNKSRGP